jgi:uncharacterized membrane protein YccC
MARSRLWLIKPEADMKEHSWSTIIGILAGLSIGAGIGETFMGNMLLGLLIGSAMGAFIGSNTHIHRNY